MRILFFNSQEIPVKSPVIKMHCVQICTARGEENAALQPAHAQRSRKRDFFIE